MEDRAGASATDCTSRHTHLRAHGWQSGVCVVFVCLEVFAVRSHVKVRLTETETETDTET